MSEIDERMGADERTAPSDQTVEAWRAFAAERGLPLEEARAVELAMSAGTTRELKQGVSADASASRSSAREIAVMLACAAGTGIVARTLIWSITNVATDSWWHRPLLALSPLVILGALAGYLMSRRQDRRSVAAAVALIFGAGTAVLTIFPDTVGAVPLGSSSDSWWLAFMHLLVVEVFAVGLAHIGPDWRSPAARMEFVRFAGEAFIYYVLIALGGGVLTALTIGVFSAIGIDAEVLVTEWILPVSAAGAVIVAAWLAETRRALGAGIAPLLARIFTPLFSGVLLALIGGIVWTRGIGQFDRDLLIAFDALLVLVVALVIYNVSNREPAAGPGLYDRLQLALIGSALAVDLFVLVKVALRLAEFGFTPNRTAIIGLNLILLANLVWAAVLQWRLARGRGEFGPVVAWQMRYLTVYALWATIVTVVFPPLFGFR